MTGTYWRDDAACRFDDADLFDPVGVEANPRERIDSATAICEECPVAVRCLLEARLNEDSGVRGGKLLNLGKTARLPAHDHRAKRVPLHPCGTVAAARRHARAGEELCGPCRDAKRDYQRRYRPVRVRSAA